MKPINTKLTALLNLKTPIISGPMFGASNPEMAAAVSHYGGLGLIAAGFTPSSQLKQDLRTIRSKLQIPDGTPVTTGVGFLAWILDITEDSDDPRIPAVLDEMPAAIWFAFGLDLGRYVAQVRAYDAKRTHKTIIFVMTQTVEEAVRAAKEWKVDVIVVQGTEAGGHGGSHSPPTYTAIHDVLLELPNGPPVVAAGGIMDGHQIASLLTLGAAGVVVGTRFLYTHECMYTEDLKTVLLETGPNSTARGMMFDEVNSIPVAWPPGVDGRAIANKIVDDVREGLSLEERKQRFQTSKAKGERDRLVVWAGAGAGTVKELRSTGDVIDILHTETVEVLTSARSLLSS